jgi:polyisoprenyl-teichoic acid--peptidoglycan teichoic acid transferase
MNEFRNKQPGNGLRRPQRSIDGFATSRRAPIGAGSARPQSGSNPAKRLDDFKRPEGMTPRDRVRSVQQSAQPPQQQLRKPRFTEPMIVDAPRKKRRFFNPFNRSGKPMTRKKKIILSIAGLLALVALVGGFLAIKGYINLNKVLNGGGNAAALQENVDPSKLKGEGDGRVNILMVGRGGEGHEGADLTDTIILVSIDPLAKETAMLSIPRDLYVDIPGYGSGKINSAFSDGKQAAFAKATRNKKVSTQEAEAAGFELLEETIRENLGVSIHYHAMVDFAGFRQAIDTVGGVDINAPTAVREQMRIDGRGYLLDVKPGQQHMDGFKALAYSRSRHTSARGDFDRAERQRAVIIALKQKLLTTGTVSNPSKIAKLLDTMGSHVTSNFSIEDLTRLYQLGKEIDQSKIRSVGLSDPPNNYVTTGMVGNQSVVYPTAGVDDYSKIKTYLRSILTDSYIKKENASIMVLNGTETPGLAGSKKEELASYGYNITSADNAPTKDYTKTVIVDLRSDAKKYTKNYLEKRFGVKSVSVVPDANIQPGTADFVIILGSDQASNE